MNPNFTRVTPRRPGTSAPGHRDGTDHLSRRRLPARVHISRPVRRAVELRPVAEESCP